MLRKARNDLIYNETVSDAFGAAYVTLQSLNISLGMATLPCSVPDAWVKNVVVGSGTLAGFIRWVTSAMQLSWES